jgi:hypothetical protein
MGELLAKRPQFFLQSDEPGVFVVNRDRVAVACGEYTHRLVVVERIGEHAPDTRSRRLAFQPCEQGIADSTALPIIGDSDGEFAARRIALFYDVSRLADHGLLPAFEYLREQREMTAVVDLAQALRHCVWKLAKRSHKAGVAGHGRERMKELPLQFKVLRQHRAYRHPAAVGRRHDIDEVHRIMRNRVDHDLSPSATLHPQGCIPK